MRPPAPHRPVAPSAVLATGVILLALLASADASASMSHRAGRMGYHGAIAFHPPTHAVGYAYDFRSARQADVAALRQCGHAECEVVVHVRNACAVLMRDGGKLHHGRGATRDEALVRARRGCSAKECDEVAWVCTR